MSLFSLCLFFLFSSSPLSVLSVPFDVSYNIDCGSPANTTDPYNATWLSDRFFTGGVSTVVSEPLRFHHSPEKTLRFFPPSSGKKNCYNLPVPAGNGRFYIRTFTVYDNYDGKSRSPSFDVSVEGTVVFSWRSPWDESLTRDGAYSDLFAAVSDGEINLCFYGIATDPPVIGSLQVKQIDSLAYDSATLGGDFILVNYGRFSCGSEQWGPGFSNDGDAFGRSWQSDKDFRSEDTEELVRGLSTRNSITGTNQEPNYFPMKLYQSSVTIADNRSLEYELPVDAKLDYLLWFHFAEIDSSVTKAGERVFDILINGIKVNRIDVYAAVGSFAAHSWQHTVKNLSNTVLNVKLVPVQGAPVISGLENYALVPADLSTVPEEVVAMKALKESLRVPDRMGWNGDPCAPTTWDAWEGVTCHLDKNGSALMISQIDLGSQGLKGYISDQISLLSNLLSLNLSSNSLEGGIPSGLGQKSLVRLDLSGNQFSGPIPDSLASSQLQLVLLNGNQLEGQVPEELYSIGVHGGAIDLSGNKGLCGVPSLPPCPMFWDHGGLSNGGKIAIGVASSIVFLGLLLVVYICCIRKGNNDYDFGLPHELLSLAAKRNRYHRQKSLMHLEMESQHAKALPSPFNHH